MTLDEKLAAIKKQLAEKRASMTAHQSEIRTLLEKDTEEDTAKAAETRKLFDAEKSDVADLEEKRDLYEAAINGNTEPATPGNKQEKSYREALNAFIRSRGAETEGIQMEKTEVGTFAMVREGEPADASDVDNAGIKSPDVKPTIADDVSYVPRRELQDVVDLAPYTNVQKVTHKKGSWPTLANATTKMATVEELQKNPAMAKPEFGSVDWDVDTYRQALPLSQESIDDSEVDLMALISENANQIKLNTRNYAVATAMKKFTAQEVADLDALKTLNNVTLPRVYARAIIASASFYNWLDTIKDNDGRYLLQDSIISPSGKAVFGIPIAVVDDDVLGAAGEAHAFFGDIKRAIFYANRVDFMVRWVDDQVYGQFLQAGMRFGVSVADAKAGYFLTHSPKA
jgi:HK97 family phage major capsid protein